MMSHKQIEASRELRLWIGQVIVPAAVGAAFILRNPQTRQMISNKANKVKMACKKKFKKD